MTESPDRIVGLQLRVGADDERAELLEELTSALQRELSAVTAVDSVTRPHAGEAPPASKGLDVLAIGTLIVTLAKSAGGLTAVTGAVRAWLSGQPDRSVKLELDGDTIEIQGLSSAAQDQLIAHWIERHAHP